jgi:hypothetical protein
MANVGITNKGRARYQPSVGRYRPVGWFDEQEQTDGNWSARCPAYGGHDTTIDFSKLLIRVDPERFVDRPRVHPSGEMRRTQLIAAAAAGLAVFGVICFAGSLFGFGAAIAYGFTLMGGIGLVAMGFVALLIAAFLGRITERRLSHVEASSFSTYRGHLAPER